MQSNLMLNGTIVHSQTVRFHFLAAATVTSPEDTLLPFANINQNRQKIQLLSPRSFRSSPDKKRKRRIIRSFSIFSSAFTHLFHAVCSPCAERANGKCRTMTFLKCKSSAKNGNEIKYKKVKPFPASPPEPTAEGRIKAFGNYL